ncbi:hypothetical protein MOTC310_09250 [Methylobacterium oryzae]|uniref:Uncharacterized protein n=1 Tax=Methylobacterium oryzae TaxID=334852 RepID=A0ABU7TLP0_9HYPH
MSSKNAACQLGRPHTTVLAAIDVLIERCPVFLGQKSLPEFGEAATGNGGTRETRAFLMNRDGFSLLIAGFTGERALSWKHSYIKAFNVIEAVIRSRTTLAVLGLNDSGALRGLLLGYAERVLALEAQVAKPASATPPSNPPSPRPPPKVKFSSRFAEAHGHCGLQNSARATKAPPNQFSILAEVRRGGRLVVVDENHTVVGGLGEAVAGLLFRNGVLPERGFRQVGLPDEFPDAGALPTLHDRYGLSTEAMARSIRGWL